MAKTVRDLLGNHAADVAGVPAIPAAVSELTALIGQIDAAALAQATPLTGIADDKDVVRTALEEAVFLVSEALSALASATNNNTLLQEVDYSRPSLDDLSAEGLDDVAARVAARATTNQTVLTGTYGISPTQVAAIATARTNFAPWMNKPRTAAAERAGQTATIPGLARQVKLLLRGRLDRLMNRFRLTNPVLLAAYRTARVVVDRHGPGGTSPTPPVTPTPTP